MEMFKIGDIIVNKKYPGIRHRITDVYENSYEWEYTDKPKEKSYNRYDTANSTDPMRELGWEVEK